MTSWKDVSIFLGPLYIKWIESKDLGQVLGCFGLNMGPVAVCNIQIWWIQIPNIGHSFSQRDPYWIGGFLKCWHPNFSLFNCTILNPHLGAPILRTHQRSWQYLRTQTSGLGPRGDHFPSEKQLAIFTSHDWEWMVNEYSYGIWMGYENGI